MSFRFPGDLATENELWSALKNRRDLVTQIPADRWATHELQHDRRKTPGRSITFSAGVLSRIDEFDAAFFGISPREAACLDPQQRLLLELTWEAFENAGVAPSTLAGSDCAVYVGISGLDYGTRMLDDLASMTPHSMTGNTLSLAANRISYVFDLHGPSLAVDTACSSSMVALHHACNSLRAGECSVAVTAGVNLLLHPYPFVGFTKASMLSAGGRCKPFDAAGDGYVRAEGGAVVVLKPLDKAIADGDHVHAVILATGVNTDGARKTGITIPSGDAQAELMRGVLARSGLAPSDVDFIEAHGTGTAVGDPIETAAIGAVYGRQRQRPLPIGSVKANLGHLESASGMAGLVKAVLALKHRALPPALHLQTPNPAIRFDQLNLRLVREYLTLEKENDRPLIAGVNSFGFGGANAHVLLQEYQDSPAPEVSPSARADADLVPLLISARSTPALRELAQRYADLLTSATPQQYQDIAHAAVFQRDFLDKRLAVRADTVDAAIEALVQYAEGGAPANVLQEDGLPTSGDIAFVYAGNGAQWVGMGQRLHRESPRFRAIIEQLDAAMQARAGFSLVSELLAEPAQARLDDTTVAQPLLFALQVALTEMLRDWGIRPSAVLGHSVGEIAAAWACGALELEQAIDVICARSQAQGLTRGKGRMAVTALAAADVQAEIAAAGLGADVELAGFNSPTNVTLSGSLAGLQVLQARLQARGIALRLLELDYAFHSRHMEPIAPELARRLAGLVPSPAARAAPTRFVSTVTGTPLEPQALDASYWWRNVREPVRFADGMAEAARLGCTVFVEIGPHAILQRYMNETLASLGTRARVLPTLRRDGDGVDRVADAALRVHLLAGRRFKRHLYPHPVPRLHLPGYPWQRERHWQPQTSESLLAIERRRVHPLLGWPVPEAELSWDNVLDPVNLPWLADHQVGGATVFPGAAYAEMALAAGQQWLGRADCVVEQLTIVAPLVFDAEHARSLRLRIQPRDGTFQIQSRQRLSRDAWTLHASGRLLQPSSRVPVARIAAPKVAPEQIDRATHYRRAARLGLDYGPAFQRVQAVQCAGEWLQASLQPSDGVDAAGYLLHPAVLDACFQTLVDFFGERIDAGQGVALLPVKIERLQCQAGGSVHRVRARLVRASARSVLVDFELFDHDGQLLASACGCRFRAAHLKHAGAGVVSRWQISPWLSPHPLDGLQAPMPPLAQLLEPARMALAPRAAEREKWFKESLPLLEALTLSLAYEACGRLAQQDPQGWSHKLRTPYGRWLARLLHEQGLLHEHADGWQLAADAQLPAAQELWQLLLRDSPASLPQLTLLAQAGTQLAALLDGQVEAGALATQLTQSPIAEALYQADPAYLGTQFMLEGLLRHLAERWPASRRLRVLEISAGPSELPRALLASLAPDRFDYVLALTTEATQARQQVEYQDHPQVTATCWPAAGLTLDALPPRPERFDLIILHHSLHRSTQPGAMIARLRERLAQAGLLLVAERHPDWSADFLAGIDPAWWHDAGDQPASSLLPPAAWQHLLQQAGWSDCTVLEEAAAAGLAEGAYLLLASNPSPAPAAPQEPGAIWQLVADPASQGWAAQLQQELVAQGQQVALHASLDTAQRSDHVVCLLGWADPCDQAGHAIGVLLHGLQALEGPAPRLWLVTRGAAPAGGRAGDCQPSPAQSALWGFGRVLMNEWPQLACTLIDLAAPLDTPDLLARVRHELLQPDGASEVILGAQARHVPLLQQQADTAAAPRSDRFRLDFHVAGQLRNLQWLPAPEAPLGAHEIEVRTQATGLNFRDVMYLMGLLPDEAVEHGFAGASLGLEFSGVVSRVGTQVTQLQPGDAVMGFGASCFASHVVTPADTVARLPEGWSFEAAATVPTAFLTVYYALRHLADLQPGERLLIHGAAGGVGIAAIQLARHLGADVLATAGSDEKRAFVRLLGADHVFDSRSLDFADDVLAATDGQGVDVVLNSLAGEAMRRSLDVLKPFGRFLELGKRDFFENTPVGLRRFRNNISYFGIDADQLLVGRPRLASRLFAEVMALFRKGALAPLPWRAFAADRVVEAFRTMQQARHIGKIVVSMAGARPTVSAPAAPATPVQLDGTRTWLVTGGLSGFGLATAQWLASRGVRHLALVGRSGVPTAEAEPQLAALADQGVQVRALACDLTDAQAVNQLVAELAKAPAPLGGVVHAATQYDDRLIARIDDASLHTVLGAKLQGAWHLHEATRQLPLQHFILFSSFTTAIGNPGQGSYVAANAGLEGLAALRQREGLPVTCVSWGPIGDAGYLARREATRDSLAQRLGKPPLGAAQALDQLDRLLGQGGGCAMPANFDWTVLARVLPSSGASRFALLNHLHRGTAPEPGDVDIRALLADKSPAEAAALVQALVVEELSNILSIAPERIEPTVSLHELGMDSLMAVELALGLEQRFGVQLPVMALNDSPTVHNVSARILERLAQDDVQDEAAASKDVVSSLLSQHGEALSAQEVQHLADDARTLAQTGTDLT